jgi:hypothetical protein
MPLAKLRSFAAVVCVLGTVSAVPSNAAVVFESASFTGVDTGEYIGQANRLIGAAFTITETTAITGIGAQFGGFPSGTIFGAIVPLPSGTDSPSFCQVSSLARVLGTLYFLSPVAFTI